jgi:propanol-preferring alcohol dehydrogenase
MKSYCLCAFGQPLELRENPTPVPSGAEVVLAVKAAGVCHSDLHMWEGGYDLGNGRKLSVTDRGVTLPMTLGHETVGEVIAFGPDASGVEIGQNYLVYPWLGCGECDVCKAGFENYCLKSSNIGIHRPGGYADHLHVPHSRYLVPIGDLDPAELAPYACSGVTVYSALKKFGETIKRRRIVIIGAGGLGLMALAILQAMEGLGAVVVEIDPAKRQAARDAGAIDAIDPNEADAIARIQQAVSGPCEAVLDLVGSPQSSQLGFDCLTKGGTMVMVGLFGGTASWPLVLIPVRGISILGNVVGNLEETKEVVSMVRQGKLKPIPITRMKLDEANAALTGLREGQFVGRVVLCAYELE